MDNYIASCLNKLIQVITLEGRVLNGFLTSYDLFTNIVLFDCKEKIFNENDLTQSVSLGVYVIRGDNVLLISKLDENIENKIIYNTISSKSIDPLKLQ